MPKSKQPNENSPKSETITKSDDTFVDVPSPVAPVESVEEVRVGEDCWNCDDILKDGICPNCGFDKSLLHNLDLEAEQAAKRQEQQVANKIKEN